MTGKANRTAERRRDLDLLRVLIVFGLVFFHTARIFDTLPLPEGVKNEPPSATATIFVAFISLWGMPLMFAISGFAVWHSLRRRTGAAFLRERVQRLVVPFVFGVLAIVPLQVYFHLKQVDPALSQTYWQFLPHFFDVRLCPDLVNAFICPNPATGLFTTTHLWFLKDLFIFSVLLLPLFIYRQGQRGRLLVGKLAGLLARPGAILLLGLPVAVVEAGLVTSTMGGGWNEYTYVILLVGGFLIAADSRFGQALGRGWRSALVIGLVIQVVYVGGLYVLTEVYKIDPLHSYDWGSLLWRAVRGVGRGPASSRSWALGRARVQTETQRVFAHPLGLATCRGGRPCLPRTGTVHLRRIPRWAPVPWPTPVKPSYRSTSCTRPSSL
jgi:glucan biosynthesis protein C